MKWWSWQAEQVFLESTRADTSVRTLRYIAKSRLAAWTAWITRVCVGDVRLALAKITETDSQIDYDGVRGCRIRASSPTYILQVLCINIVVIMKKCIMNLSRFVSDEWLSSKETFWYFVLFRQKQISSRYYRIEVGNNATTKMRIKTRTTSKCFIENVLRSIKTIVRATNKSKYESITEEILSP